MLKMSFGRDFDRIFPKTDITHDINFCESIPAQSLADQRCIQRGKRHVVSVGQRPVPGHHGPVGVIPHCLELPDLTHPFQVANMLDLS